VLARAMRAGMVRSGSVTATATSHESLASRWSY
jgi:hypothetical protein